LAPDFSYHSGKDLMMNEKRYWFPVRPARNGWGWGLPQVWQGWAVLAAFFVLLVASAILLAPYGQMISIAVQLILAALLFAIVWWKGEPQSMRDEGSP
jgi:hypothetical protein